MSNIIHQFMKLSLWLFAISFIVQLLYSWINADLWKIGSLTDIATISVSFIGKAVAITTIAMSMFNKFAWKWKIVKCIHNVPILKNAYEGRIMSTYDGVERLGKMIITQTFLNISVKLSTNESQSRSVTTYLDGSDGSYRLIYTYQNEPHAEVQERSPIHYGTAILDICDEENLEGNYFTGRKTTGSMKFTAVSE